MAKQLCVCLLSKLVEVLRQNSKGVLAKGRAKDSAEEIEELGRELGLAGARPLLELEARPGDRDASPPTGDPRGAKGLP